HALPADAQHLGDGSIRASQCLQRVGHQHRIEALVRKVGQAEIEVGLDDVDAASDALGDLLRIDFDAVALDVVTALEHVEQGPVSAAEIENSAAGGDPAPHDVEIAPQHQQLSATWLM